MSEKTENSVLAKFASPLIVLAIFVLGYWEKFF